MRMPTNTLLRYIYAPRHVFFSRTVFACIIVSFLAAGTVYVKQRHAHKQVVEQTASDYIILDNDYSQTLVAMQAHIVALNSRIKHLVVDNKRLSSTGHQLSEQLRTSSTSNQEKLAQTQGLQLELYAMDQHLIHKYDGYIEQQKNASELRNECEKSKDKNDKCQKYFETQQTLEDSVVQIKFLKNKREVLLSEIARAAAGI